MSSRFAPYGWSLLVHAVLIGLLGVSLHAPTPRLQPVVEQQAQEPEPIQAKAVAEAQVAAEVQRLRDETRRKQQQEDAQRRQLQDEAQRAREMRQREEQRTAELKRRAEEEQKQRALVAQERKAQEAAEQKRLAELKKAQAEAEKKRLAEEKRAAELATQRKKELAEQELKAKMAEAQRQMEAEAEKRAQESARQNSSLRQQYIADIRNKVERNWLRPPSARPGMTCTVLVQQLPTGDVVSVRITRSSGDAVFDRSVENAVHKTKSLPPAPVPEVWEREVEFIFEAR